MDPCFVYCWEENILFSPQKNKESTFIWICNKYLKRRSIKCCSIFIINKIHKFQYHSFQLRNFFFFFRNRIIVSGGINGRVQCGEKNEGFSLRGFLVQKYFKEHQILTKKRFSRRFWIVAGFLSSKFTIWTQLILFLIGFIFYSYYRLLAHTRKLIFDERTVVHLGVFLFLKKALLWLQLGGNTLKANFSIPYLKNDIYHNRIGYREILLISGVP